MYFQEGGATGVSGKKMTPGQKVAVTPKMAMDSFRFSVLDQAGKSCSPFSCIRTDSPEMK